MRMILRFPRLRDRLRGHAGRLALCGTLAASAACGGGELALPSPPGPKDFRISPVGDSARQGRVGEALPESLKVAVSDADGRPVADWQIAFVLPDGAVAGTLDPEATTTDADGHASFHWQLGTVPGTYLAEARVVALGETDLPATQFRVDVAAGPPDALRAVSPLQYRGRRGEALPDSIVVAVTDRYGNPVPGVAVTWTVQTGKGSVSPTPAPTDAAGHSSVRWTLGDRAGVQKLAAELEGITGSPVVFSALVVF